MQTFTIDDIRRAGPCYDPVTGRDKNGKVRRETGLLPADWKGTLLDILAVEDCPMDDRMWAVLQFLNESDLRLLACAMVRYSPLPDGRRRMGLAHRATIPRCGRSGRTLRQRRGDA